MVLIEFVCVFVLVIVLSHFLAPLFISMGIVAHDGGRHIHNGSVPLVGGTAMLLTLAISEFLFLKNDSFEAHFYALLFLSVIPVFLVSLLDDRYEVHPLMRLTVQAFSVLISMRVLGFEISYIGTNELQMPLGIWATPFTVVTGLFFINAFNIPLTNVCCMPGMDSRENFHERTRWVMEMGIKYKFIMLAPVLLVSKF